MTGSIASQPITPNSTRRLGFRGATFSAALAFCEDTLPPFGVWLRLDQAGYRGGQPSVAPGHIVPDIRADFGTLVANQVAGRSQGENPHAALDV